MVEGHSVHRVAALHRQRLVGHTFRAWSPNGRFVQGAQAIDGKVFSNIEAVGKNLFAFFSSSRGAKNDNDNDDDVNDDDDVVVVHVHFGMAGAWAVYQGEEAIAAAPQPSATNRLRLECPGLMADLSAMTVQHGGMDDLYHSKRSKLGEDPLRDDADPERLWAKVQKTNKSIGALIMDQSYFTGPGNIYRAEILFKAGVHPDVPGNELDRSEFDSIWAHTVALLRRGYETGSILTVDPEEARALQKPKLRRYIYNAAKCPRCETAIRTWTIASRTCYACPTCQPRRKTTTTAAAAVVVTPQKECVPFHSHCAPESVAERLRASGPSRLTVAELKAELMSRGKELPKRTNKSILVQMLEAALAKESPKFVLPEDAAAEKAAAGESLAVEHIAELAPVQARKARTRAVVRVMKKEEEESAVEIKPKKDARRDRSRARAKRSATSSAAHNESLDGDGVKRRRTRSHKV